MSTTGNGTSPGDFLGGDAAPTTQERPGPPPSGRSERRRISERLAEAAATAPAERPRGMPSTSPWQRSNFVWHQAGIDWSRADPPAPPGPRGAPARPASAPAPRPAAQYPAPVPVQQPAPPAGPSAGTSGPRAASTTGPYAASPAGPPTGSPAPSPDEATGDAEPWVPPKRTARAGLPLKPLAIALVAVLIVGGGAYLLFGRAGGGDARTPVATPDSAIAAGRLFGFDPAAALGGRTHSLDAVAASGSTAVAIGSEQGGVYSRAQFLVSADGGRSWSVATVRAADGGDPPQGEYPRLVAGGAGAWSALGATHDGTVAWTSRDARTWTRLPLTGAFGPGDSVKQLMRTTSGFVAAGTATVNDATQAVVWTSADGGRWTRLGGTPFAPPSGGTTVGLSEIAAHGDVVVARGRVRTVKTVTKRVRRKRRKVHRTVESEAFWRSGDGGRTWAAAGAVPQGQGSSGDVVSVAATQTGFFAAREASRTTGRKKRRRTVHYGAFFASADGTNWTPAGTLVLPGYSGIAMMRGTDGGLTVLASVRGGRTAVATSGDGKSWRHIGDLPGGRTPTGAALTSQGPLVTGRTGTGDAALTMAGAGDVNLAAVPDAVHPERTVGGITAAPGRVVAVGSTDGRAALWSSPDGATWTRGTFPATKDAGQQRLVEAVHGAAGWLAVGGTASHSLTLTSADAGAWQVGKRFAGAPAAAAAGAASYAVVGAAGGTSAAAWTSADLRTWTRARDAGKGDLDGTGDAPKWMSDVTAGPNGFVAVGGQTKNKASLPALWTSPDGRSWTLSAAPALPAGTAQGSLTKVVARGGVLVATGVAGAYVFAAVSADGGRTWQPAALPGAAPGTALTAVTATPRGFVLVGATGSDVVTWSSADGRAWRVARPHGLGLDGRGVQRLDGVTAVGANLLAVGFTADARTDGPTLWKTPAP